MKISDAGVKFICDQEGYHKKLPDGRCTTYYCPAGVLTIGYGCTEGITKGEIWTHEKAVERLQIEIAKKEVHVNRLVIVPLTQGQYDALVSFTYNCGEGALAKSSLLKKLNAKDYIGASQQFQHWNKGGGRILAGLVSRRAKEAAMFMGDAPKLPDKPVMPQRVQKQSAWDWLKPWWL